MLAMGPTIAMKSSDAGVGGSRSMFDTPPNMWSVMSLTGMPYMRATSECAISWKRTDAKKNAAESAATTTLVATVQSECHDENSDVRLHVTRPKIRSQL